MNPIFFREQVIALLKYISNPFNRYYFPLCTAHRERAFKKLTGKDFNIDHTNISYYI